MAVVLLRPVNGSINTNSAIEGTAKAAALVPSISGYIRSQRTQRIPSGKAISNANKMGTKDKIAWSSNKLTIFSLLRLTQFQSNIRQVLLSLDRSNHRLIVNQPRNVA